MTDHNDPAEGISLPNPEDFWLELGPASAYYGTDAYETALREGDLSPDAKHLGWPENYRPQDAEAEAARRAGLAAAADFDLDDVPPEDR